MDNKKFEVISKYNGYLVITEANTNVKRIWPKLGDKLNLTIDNIQAILTTPGGRRMLENYLIVPKEVLEKLEIYPEPEYFYTLEDIKALLEKGSIEQLEDALTFAPIGTIDLIRETAVQMKITDRNKIQLITQKTGFDIESQIKLYDEIYGEKVEEQKARKAAPFKAESGEPKRKADPITSSAKITGSKYRVVQK